MAAKRPCFLGIDIGTSGLKSVLVSADDGELLAASLYEYRPLVLEPGGAEQEPETWVDAAVATVRHLIATEPADILGIGLSGQMHSTVTLDAQGEAVRPAILWLDRRGAPQAASLHEVFGESQLARWTGNPVMPGLTLISLLWMREHEPERWGRVARVLLAKDYLRYRLTGTLATDCSDASASGMLCTGRRAWCMELMTALNLPATILPPLYESTQVVGTLRRDMATRMSLATGIPVVCGAGDQAAQAIGNGIIRPGTVSSTIGTGGQLFAVADRYHPDPHLRLHTFCHAAPGRWHWLAATLTAGLSLRWLRDQVLGGNRDYAELADAAATIEPGAEGLIFLPHLAGERTPHMNPHARGVFIGLTLHHTWRHMVRAVMEGVLFSLTDGMKLIHQMGEVRHIVASGGGTRHPLWLQLQADTYGRPVVRTETREAAALGAALLAGVGTGFYPNLETACQVAVRWSDEVFTPRPTVHALYQELGSRYRALYRVLTPHFKITSEWRPN